MAAPPLVRTSAAPRVLLAESDHDTRSVYQGALAAIGCEAIEAVDGREALVNAFMCRPSLLITEMRLPFLDGYALCEILRRDANTVSLPILAITTETRGDELARAVSAGADVVLVKPAPLGTILDTAQRLMARGRPAPAADRAAGPARKLIRSHRRFNTTTPPSRPPALVCPNCGGTLRYERSHIGGVNPQHAEQWDYYVCSATCGTFQYRQRTRRLRLVG